MYNTECNNWRARIEVTVNSTVNWTQYDYGVYIMVYILWCIHYGVYIMVYILWCIYYGVYIMVYILPQRFQRDVRRGLVLHFYLLAIIRTEETARGFILCTWYIDRCISYIDFVLFWKTECFRPTLFLRKRRNLFFLTNRNMYNFSV